MKTVRRLEGTEVMKYGYNRRQAKRAVKWFRKHMMRPKARMTIPIMYVLANEYLWRG